MATQTKKKRSKKKETINFAGSPEKSNWIDFTASASAGALLGLSAPGFDLWYLAWVGLIPLLLLTASSKNAWQAFLRGLTFGVFYNLIYLNWYLSLYPIDWLGFNQWQGIALAAAAWLIVSFHQGLLIAMFSAICRLIPLTGSILPRQREGIWHLPALLVIPLSWVLIENKLGNAHDWLGVPWSMIEYSQYQRLPLIQAASWIGGIGISVLIVATNFSLAGLLATLSKKANWKSLAQESLLSSFKQIFSVSIVIAAIYTAGLYCLVREPITATTNLAVVQSNINIDMQKRQAHYTLAQLIDRSIQLMGSLQPGLCIFTENALPSYIRTQSRTIDLLSNLAKQKKADFVVGAMDRDEDGHPYNSAYGISSQGKLLPTVYHKRYLVPFGEYTPYLIQFMPEWLRRLTNTPSGGGFACGLSPAVLSLPSGKVAPLICFECLSPELAASSIRAGGRCLVNLSDLAWFHDSMIGQQMLAFAVLRAVENRRYFVFAANSGPSAIINPQGKITTRSQTGEKQLMLGKVGFSSELTPFTVWFH